MTPVHRSRCRFPRVGDCFLSRDACDRGLDVLRDGGAGLRGVLQDVGEGVRVEAGTTDEGAVDLGLGHEGGDVVGLDAAAVEDADVGGGVLAEALGDGAADDAVRVGDLFGTGDAAGANGPDGLVGDEDGACLLGLDAVGRRRSASGGRLR
jgi:hypothetical protein